MPNKHICLAISGASGFQYGLRLLAQLLRQDCHVYLLVSDAAREVARLEADIELSDDKDALKQQLLQLLGLPDENLNIYSKRDWLSPVASGSAPMDAMIVCPCSTGTLAAIANGHSNNLLERAATVTLKERRPLVLLTREMPLSAIQLEQMHKLALMGVSIMPASPGFYHKPSCIDDLLDFVVARILQQVGLSQDLIRPWGSNA
jgi:4-hydroxy-3-polyprenylbenzoate decarboxylase